MSPTELYELFRWLFIPAAGGLMALMWRLDAMRRHEVSELRDAIGDHVKDCSLQRTHIAATMATRDDIDNMRQTVDAGFNEVRRDIRESGLMREIGLAAVRGDIKDAVISTNAESRRGL